MPNMPADTRAQVIETAKKLKREGIHYRYFSARSEIWECYQAEYLPDIGERAWLASPIRAYVIQVTDKIIAKPNRRQRDR